MSLLWIIRIILISLAFSIMIITGLFMKDQEKYEKFYNNKPLNIFLITLLNVACFLCVAIPSDPNVIPPPAFLSSEFINITFIILGDLSLGFGLFLIIKTFIIRRKHGLKTYEEVPAHVLITYDVYRYFRHPLYSGVLMNYLAFLLVFSNYDGFLIFPLIIFIFLLGAKFEEKYDVGLKFEKEYAEYKKKTRILGPLWFWAIIITGLLLIYYFTFTT